VRAPRGGSIALVPLGFIGSEFVPSSDTGVLTGSLQYPVGQPLAVTARGMSRLEDKLVHIDGVESVLSTIGSKNAGNSNDTGGHLAQFTVILEKDRRRETNRVLAAARTRDAVPGASYQIATLGGGGSGGSPIQFRLTGPDSGLDEGAERIAALDPPAARERSTCRRGGRTKVRGSTSDVDARRANVLGVAPADAANGRAHRDRRNGRDAGAPRQRPDRRAPGTSAGPPRRSRDDRPVAGARRERSARAALVGRILHVHEGTDEDRAPSARAHRDRLRRRRSELGCLARHDSERVCSAKIDAPGFLPPGVHASRTAMRISTTRRSRAWGSRS
jgi:HAE1 family hydrophobic/amphiphilic exporter-1